jgi:hypothetical protein
MTSIRLERTLHDILMMQNTSALTMPHIHETCKKKKKKTHTHKLEKHVPQQQFKLPKKLI